MLKTSAPLILLTRPKAAASRFAQALRARLGAVDILISPVIDINYINPSALPEAEAMVFTSVHGLSGYVSAGGRCNGEAYCVGQSTAEAAHDQGFKIASVAQTVQQLEPVLMSSQKQLLFARGTHVACDLALRYPHISEVIVYDQKAQKFSAEAKAALSGEQIVILPLFSPRSAKETASQISGTAPRRAAFMSKAVADAVEGIDVEASLIAKEPTAASMLDATEMLYDVACSRERRRRGG